MRVDKKIKRDILKISKIKGPGVLCVPKKIENILNYSCFDVVIFEKRKEEDFVRSYKWKQNPDRKKGEEIEDKKQE